MGIVVKNSQLALAKVLRLFNPILKEDSSIDPRAYVSKNSKIGKNVSIDPGACIKDGAKIGDGCKIGTNSYIGENAVLENNCEIHANVSIYFGTNIGENVIIAARSGVTKNLRNNSVVAGFPAIDMKEWKKTVIRQRKYGH